MRIQCALSGRLPIVPALVCHDGAGTGTLSQMMWYGMPAPSWLSSLLNRLVSMSGQSRECWEMGTSAGQTTLRQVLSKAQHTQNMLFNCPEVQEEERSPDESRRFKFAGWLLPKTSCLCSLLPLSCVASCLLTSTA